MSSKECDAVSGQNEAEKSVLCNFSCQSAFKSEDLPEKIPIFALLPLPAGLINGQNRPKKWVFASFVPVEFLEYTESAKIRLIYRAKASLITFSLLRVGMRTKLGQATLKIGRFALFSVYIPIYRAQKVTFCPFQLSRVLRMLWKCTNRANSPRKGQFDYF